MKVAVILENTGGELDRQEFEVAEGDADAVNDKASAIVEGWILSAGDTIRIVGEA
jgi:hypothetical protein